MNYLLIEFLGVFFLVFFLSLTNVAVDHNSQFRVSNSLNNGLIYLIFTILSKNLSQGLFNPSFAIVQNLFDKLTLGQTTGYVGSHIIAGLFATSIIPRLIPHENFLDRENLYCGVKKIPEDIEYMSVFTTEILGTMILFLGFLFYRETAEKSTLGDGAIYYGAMAAALSFSTFDISGGTYNLAVIIGGIVFDNVLDFRLVGLFLGNVFGCIIARLLHSKIFGVHKEEEDNKALKMLLKE